MRTVSRRRPALLALLCAFSLALTCAVSACSSSGSSTSGSGEALAPASPAATAAAASSDHFVITWAKGSEAASFIDSVDAYGVDIIGSLPQKDQEALRAAAEQASVVVEQATAHVGGLTTVKLSEALTPEKSRTFIDALTSSDSVETAEPELRVTALDTSAGTPNDEYFGYQWGLTAERHGVNATSAWSQSTGKGATVAVLDTGVLPDHPDIGGQLLPGYDFISDSWTAGDDDGRDDDPTDTGDGVAADACGNGNKETKSTWHGSHVAGIIAASTNNSTGVAGVAPDAKILPVRVLGRCGGGTDLIDALTWASGGSVKGAPDNANPAQVINLSLGGSGTCPAYLQKAIDDAVDRGSIIVASAGNEDQDVSGVSPGGCENVITVGASNGNGARSFYSNYGTGVEVSAPGGDPDVDSGILSLSQQSAPDSPPYAFMAGTSQAAPHVAGTVALLKSVDPSLTTAKATTVLQDASQPLTSCDRDACGTGIVDAAAAVTALSSEQSPGGAPTEDPGPGEAGAGDGQGDGDSGGLRRNLGDLWDRISGNR